jgi:hypothetical protein
MPNAYTPRIPEKSLAQEFWTYQDAVEWLLDYFGRTTASARDMRLAKRAIDNAYAAFGQSHNWRFYRASYAIHTDASYKTGTIAYDHTGGTYERQVTLTGGTWPVNAAYGSIKLNEYGPYEIQERKSDTVITLLQDQNPGVDIAAGASYRWWRMPYPLPLDFAKMAEPLDETTGWGLPGLRYIEPDVMFGLSRWWGLTTVSQPGTYTIYTDRRTGMESIYLGEPPAVVRSYGFQYIRRPRPLRVGEYATGTVTVSSGSTALEGTGTTWTAEHAGCILRVASDNKTKPTSPFGSLDGKDNPAVLTRVIWDRTDADTLVMDVSSDVTKSGVRYTLSDPIDIEWGTAGTYFQRLCEYHFSCLANDTKKIPERKALVDEEYKNATAADQRRIGFNASPWSRQWPYVSGVVSTNMDSL